MLDNSPTGNLFLDVTIFACIFIGLIGLSLGMENGLFFFIEKVAKRSRRKKAAYDTEFGTNSASLAQAHTGLEEQIAQVGSAVTFLKEEKLQETARQEALQGKEFTVEKITALLYAVSGEVQELRQWVRQLTIERDALVKGNAQLVTKLSLQQEQTSRQTAARHAQLQEQEYEQE